MKYHHNDLAKGRWNKLSFCEQMANIGSEIGRTINWRKKDHVQSRFAFFRALELVDFTINDPKNKKRLKEIVRMREVLVDYFFGENIYKSSDRLWENYFYGFNWKARIQN